MHHRSPGCAFMSTRRPAACTRTAPIPTTNGPDREAVHREPELPTVQPNGRQTPRCGSAHHFQDRRSHLCSFCVRQASPPPIGQCALTCEFAVGPVVNVSAAPWQAPVAVARWPAGLLLSLKVSGTGLTSPPLSGRPDSGVRARLRTLGVIMSAREPDGHWDCG
jgi:hypothetical protein